MALIQPKCAENKPVNMLLFAELADLAYQPASVIRQGLLKKGMGFECDFEFLEGPSMDTQGFLLAQGGDVIICFRGTEPPKITDWLTDLAFWQKPVVIEGETYEVHGGFWQALNDVWPHIASWLSVKGAGKKIWLVGHSLGGALACLTLARIFQAGMLSQVQGLYTYGCPRSVGYQMAEKFNAQSDLQVFRMVNDQDIVPHVPPDAKYIDAMDFSHFGTSFFFPDDGQIYIGKEQNIWEQSKLTKDRLVSSIINKVFDAINIYEKIADHSPKNYCRLGRLYQEQESVAG